MARSEAPEPPDLGAKRWRRVLEEALLWPGAYAQLLATRPEMQLGADWLLVPAARNLHWRYEVLHSAFIGCKQRLSAGADRRQNVANLINATKQIWERIATNTVTMKGVKRPINGRIELLFQDDAMDDLGRLILRSYLNTTRHIAGCQAMRQKIGHILFSVAILAQAITNLSRLSWPSVFCASPGPLPIPSPLNGFFAAAVLEKFDA